MEHATATTAINEVLFIILDNLVDGIAILNLTHGDISSMLPGKVGVARKVCVLIEQLKGCSAQPPTPVVTVTSQAQSPISLQEPLVLTRLSSQETAACVMETMTVDMVSVDQPVITATTSTEARMSLPKYSTRIQDVLMKGDILLDLDQFIEETAYHIISNGDMTSKTEYDQFGRMLVSMYKCLEFQGKKTSWVCILRNIWVFIGIHME
jgi:hypothetical protein